MKIKHAINFQNPPAIILGGGGNGLGVVRSLGRRGVFTIVISEDIEHSTMSSRFIGKKIRFIGTDDELVEMLIDNTDLQTCRPVLFPLRDASVSAIAKSFDALKDNYRLGMREPATILRALCKTSFNEMAAEMGFLTAKTFSVNGMAELETVINQIRFPCILKPEIRGSQFLKFASAKAFYCATADELRAYYQGFVNAASEVVVQEFIPGEESDLYFCFQYYNRNSEALLSLIGRKIRQWPPKCGSTSSCEAVTMPEVEALSTKFFSEINYFGPCSMEMKRHAQSGDLYLIEPTIGRTDWNNSFAEGNGIPLPYIMYCDIARIQVPNYSPKKRGRRWVRFSHDYRAAIRQIKEGELKWWKWIKTLCPPLVGPIWSIDDVSPSLFPYIKRISKNIRKLKR